MNDQAINVALLDDHPLVRQGLTLIINSIPGFTVSIEASSSDDLIAQLSAAQVLPDICILDVSMPGRNGLQTIEVLRKNWPTVRVIVLSMYHDDYIVAQMIGMGARAYLCKGEDTYNSLREALTAVYSKGFYFSSSLGYRALTAFNDGSKRFPRITIPQMTFIKHCCAGLSYDQIAKIMFVSKRTVEGYRDTLFHNLDLSTRADLCIFAIKNGLVAIDDIYPGSEVFPAPSSVQEIPQGISNSK